MLPLYHSSPPKHSLPDCLVCKPSSPASSDPDPEPACLCIDLPFWTFDLPFACSYRIDLPAWTLDLPCCLPLGINTISSPERFPMSCYWVFVCHLVKPDMLSSFSHLVHCCSMSPGKLSSHPEFLLHSSCNKILPGNVTVEIYPKVLYTELSMDSMPRLVSGHFSPAS